MKLCFRQLHDSNNHSIIHSSDLSSRHHRITSEVLHARIMLIFMLFICINIDMCTHKPANIGAQLTLWPNWIWINLGRNVASPIITINSIASTTDIHMNVGLLSRYQVALGISLTDSPKPVSASLSSRPLSCASETFEARMAAVPKTHQNTSHCCERG